MLKSIIVVYDSAEINGGAANVAIRSTIALKEAGYDVHFYAATGPINAEMVQKGIQVNCLFMNDINHGSKITAMIHGVWNGKAKKEFDRFLSSFSPEDTIVHFHGWSKALSSSVIKVATKRKFKIFITLHDYFTVCPNGGFYDYQKQEICRRVPMSWECVKCNCDKRSYLQKIWRDIRQVVQDRNVRNNPEINYLSISDLNESVVRPYVKSKKFARLNNPVNLAGDKVKNCSKSRNFLYLGRLSEEKGTELFCRAIAELKTQYDLEGVVIGDGQLLQSMKERYPTVQFEGWKDKEEVPDFLLNARALVLPSKCYEGAPLSIVEAMSTGLPCIVADCTSATELVQDGLNGLIFKANDIDSLKRSVIKALDNDFISRISEQIKESFNTQEYTDDYYIKKISGIYNRAILK